MPTPTYPLEKENIIGDIFPPNTTISYSLQVKWPTEVLDKPGKAIHRDAAQSVPEVFVDPPLQNPGKSGSYVLLMVDPDLTHRHDTKFGQVRHWLAVSASVTASGQVINLDNTISPYVGPAPIPAHLDGFTKSHPSRYTFILCRHRRASETSLPNIDTDSLRGFYEGTPGELGNASQDIIDRMKFNAQRFIERNDLEVVAASFMLVEGNLKSGLTSAGLVAQGLGDKVVGR